MSTLLPPPPLHSRLGFGRVRPILCARFFTTADTYVCAGVCVHRLHVGCSLHISPKQIKGPVPASLATPPPLRFVVCGVVTFGAVVSGVMLGGGAAVYGGVVCSAVVWGGGGFHGCGV